MTNEIKNDLIVIVEKLDSALEKFLNLPKSDNDTTNWFRKNYGTTILKYVRTRINTIIRNIEKHQYD